MICVVGGARTGTHLLNAVLCSSRSVTPLLAESVPAQLLVSAFRETRAHLTMYPGAYFDEDEEVRSLYAGFLADLVGQLRLRHRRPIVVLRQPALARLSNELGELLLAGGQKPLFLVTVRDPRDAVVSMLEWEQKRLRRGGNELVPGEDRPRALAEWLLSFYPSLLERDGSDTLVVRYEDLVQRTEETVTTLARFTGLRLKAEAHWENARVDLIGDPSGAIGGAITKLYGQPISDASVGSWKTRLDPQQADAVLEVCRPLVERFYPGIDPG